MSARQIGADVSFSRLCTDTRTLKRGDLFLALVGENFDGHQFVSQAQQLGAAAAVVSKPQETPLPQLLVEDTHRALAQIARLNRRSSAARVIALTGSQGKTTVKELLGSILSIVNRTLTTAANLNNTIGVPLTLLQIGPAHGYAVIEMGADRAGEIAFSVAAAEPDIVLITNASAAHISGFGSLSGIVQAKGEIIDGLSEQGKAILNADDAAVRTWVRRVADRRFVLFSLENPQGYARYFARDIRPGTADGSGACMECTLVTPKGESPLRLPLLGRHNVLNAIAAAAAAMEAGASLEQVVQGLTRIQPIAGRLNPQPGIGGSLVIDDSYNASPSSYRAAIDVLASYPGKKFLVAGDMRELGQDSDAAHVAVGEYAAGKNLDGLLATGESCRLMVAAAGERARHFGNKEELGEYCKTLAATNTVFLIKGSRGSAMEQVVTALIEQGKG
ncbi:MAG: UDP-N-acetylmuramoyl-tripeptide--D-alanyl-D-alanine ligase [Gammaproteobacteria bacterium]